MMEVQMVSGAKKKNGPNGWRMTDSDTGRILGYCDNKKEAQEFSLDPAAFKKKQAAKIAAEREAEEKEAKEKAAAKDKARVEAAKAAAK